MSHELVTAATFGDQTQAVVVRTVLEEAGIPAFLVGELMSQGLFVVGGATGGVHLQVPASRLDEAVRLITERAVADTAPVDWSKVDVGEPEDEAPTDAENLPEEVESPLRPAAPELVPLVEETEPTDLTLRERRANRIVRGALIGLLFAPVLVLAVYRLMQIANSEERLRPEYQRKANIGAVIVMVAMAWMLFWICLFPILITFGN